MPRCGISMRRGPRTERGEDHHPELHLIPIVLQVALGQRDDVTIFGDDYATGDGTCVRDYIHVSDLSQAHILAMTGDRTGKPCLQSGQRAGLQCEAGD